MLKAERKTQAQAAYEVLCQEGYRAFIGTKPHNCHIVSVFIASAKPIHRSLSVAMHRPHYVAKKLKGKDIVMLHFSQRQQGPLPRQVISDIKRDNETTSSS